MKKAFSAFMVFIMSFSAASVTGTQLYAEEGTSEETPEVTEDDQSAYEQNDESAEGEMTEETIEEDEEVSEEIIDETIEETEEEYSGDIRYEPRPDGWYKVNDNDWIYLVSDRAVSGWKKISGVWYYFFTEDDYSDPGHYKFWMAKGLHKINGRYYGFASSGKMLTGWQKFNNKWYFFNSDGAAATGWKKDGGKWYYLDKSTAVMATGIKKIDGKTYGFNSSGVMLTGWQTINGELYYFNSDGSAKKLFSDVKDKNKYYFNAVYWGSDKGIVAGFNNGEYFGPELECTRGQFVAFLWRMAGKPSSNAAVTFKDIKGDEYYFKALQWAVGKGIIGGYKEDNTFRPDNSVDRVSVALMLWKYAGRPNVDTSGASPFTDISEDNTPSPNSYKAVLWGQKKNIIKGYSDKTFRPFDDCLREHIVTFLYRYSTGK